MALPDQFKTLMGPVRKQERSLSINQKPILLIK